MSVEQVVEVVPCATLGPRHALDIVVLTTRSGEWAQLGRGVSARVLAG